MKNVCVTIAVLALMASAASATVIQVNFGPAIGTPGSDGNPDPNFIMWVPAGWNNLKCLDTTAVPGASLTDMIDSTGAATTVDLLQTAGKLLYSSDWRGSPVTTTGFPSVCTASYNYGAGGTTLLISGLDPLLPVEFSLFCSRQDPNVIPERNTLFTATGLNSDTFEQSALGNVSVVDTTVPITPTAAGTIEVVIAPGSDPSGYKPYANVMVLDIIPEPATMALLAIGGLGVLLRKRR